MEESQPPYFGWLKPSGDAEGHFNFKIEGSRLSKDQWDECNRAAKFFARIRPFFLDYLAVDDYYGDVLRVPKRIADMVKGDPFIFQNVSLFHLKSHLICDKAINGFVSAGAVFRDRLLSRLGIGKDSNHAIVQKLNEIYDRSFEYRLFYGLRNFSQHGDAVIDAIPMSANASDGSCTARLVIRRVRLRDRMTKMSARLRTDLDNASDEIDFEPAAKLYMECLRELFAAFLVLDFADLQFSLAFVRAVRSGARGLPPAATPILVHEIPEVVEKGEVTAGTLFDLSAMFLPIEEAALIEQLFPQLKPAYG